MQALARFAIDAPDRVLERRHRFVQVLRLRVEIGLALLRGLQLLERREVDRAQRPDLFVQTADLVLQRARARSFFKHALQRGFVGAGLGELLRILLLGQPRFLLFQAHVVHALAQRSEALLGGQPFLLDFLDARLHAFDRIARLGERLFALAAVASACCSWVCHGVSSQLASASVSIARLADSPVV